MEAKKTTKANLENSKTTHWLMSAIVALAILFVSFEWGTPITVFDYVPEGIEVDPDLPPITEPEPAPEPPPPPPAKVEIIDVIVEVPDDTDTPDTFNPGTEEKGDAMPPVPPGYGDLDSPEVPADDYFIVVETMPMFPGGDGALMSFIAKSINYPVAAIERDIEGSVVCSFIIDKDGSITDVEIVRGIDVSLDKEAMRVINLMPKWSPGMQRDKPVRVKYTMPIRFRLQK